MDQIKSEIKIQRRMDHPHILKLKYFFEDDENVYMVLPYCQNGNLFRLIKSKEEISENLAFIYFFQTCLAVEYLHNNKVIHRDLKPENLLLDKHSNIQVSDFGWSALKTTDKMRQTYCGTIDYMAPEMVSNKKYNEKVDIWSLGVLLYEMTQRTPPFRGKNQAEKNQNILKCNIVECDKLISEECMNMIKMLLEPEANKRPSFNEIFNHPFIQKYVPQYNIDVEKYREGTKKQKKSHVRQNSKSDVNVLTGDNTIKNQHIQINPVYEFNNIDIDAQHEIEDSTLAVKIPTTLETNLIPNGQQNTSNKKVSPFKNNMMEDLDSALNLAGLNNNRELGFLKDVGDAVGGQHLSGKSQSKSRDKSSRRQRTLNKTTKREGRSSYSPIFEPPSFEMNKNTNTSPQLDQDRISKTKVDLRECAQIEIKESSLPPEILSNKISAQVGELHSLKAIPKSSHHQKTIDNLPLNDIRENEIPGIRVGLSKDRNSSDSIDSIDQDSDSDIAPDLYVSRFRQRDNDMMDSSMRLQRSKHSNKGDIQNKVAFNSSFMHSEEPVKRKKKVVPKAKEVVAF